LQQIFLLEFGGFGQGGINQKRKFIRKCVRISIKSADFRIKCASFCKKRSKIFENCIETFENSIETFENIRQFFTPLRKLFETNNSRSFWFVVHSS